MTDLLRDIKIRLSLDRAAIQQSAQGADLLKRRLAELGTTTQATGTQLKRAMTAGGGSALRQMGQEARQATAEVGKLRDALDKAGKASGAKGEKINLGRALSASAQLAGGPAAEFLRAIDDVEGLAEAMGGLSKVTLGLGAAVIGASLAISAYNEEIKRQKEILAEEINARRDLARFQQQATSQEAQQRLAQLLDEQKIITDQMDFLKQRLGAAFGTTTLDPALRALQETYNDLGGELSKNQFSVDLLSKALFAGAFAANDAAKAQAEAAKQAADLAKKEKELQEARDIEGYKESIRATLEIQDLIKRGTQEEIDSRRERLQEERKLVAATAVELKILNKPSQEFVDRLKEIDGELSILADADKGIKARDNLKTLTSGIAGFVTEIVKIGSGAVEAAQEKLKERNQQLASEVSKYDEDVQSIEQKALEKRAGIQKEYNDRLVEIARTAADAAGEALRRLEDRRAELGRDLARAETDAARKAEVDRLDTIIDAQRQERDAYQAHLNRLEDIRRQSQRAEEDAILNRDFASLFRIRRDTGYNLSDASRDFIRERQQRQQQLTDQLSDLARAAETERQQRLIQYQQNLADAQAQYVRERQDAERARQQQLAEARNTRNRQLQEERQSYQAQLQQRRQALVAELQMIVDFGQRRLQIEQQNAQRALDILRSVSTVRVAPYAPTRRAAGGPLGLGQDAYVNEFGSSGAESFRTPRGSLDFPGFGLFTPYQSGRVEANKGGKTITLQQTNNITSGANPEAVARLVEQKTMKLLERVLA